MEPLFVNLGYEHNFIKYVYLSRLNGILTKLHKFVCM